MKIAMLFSDLIWQWPPMLVPPPKLSDSRYAPGHRDLRVPSNELGLGASEFRKAMHRVVDEYMHYAEQVARGQEEVRASAVRVPPFALADTAAFADKSHLRLAHCSPTSQSTSCLEYGFQRPHCSDGECSSSDGEYR